jgi:cell division protein FtsN
LRTEVVVLLKTRLFAAVRHELATVYRIDMNFYRAMKSQQQGSTLTGFIIGLVVGLAVAVVVALLINKTSTPFTNNKQGKAENEVATGQLQDPNKPLYGKQDAVKDAVQEVAKQSASKAVEAQAKANAPASAAATTAPHAATAPASATAPTTAASNAAVTEDKYIYFLQIGAFKEQADAEGARAKMALLGLEAKVSEKVGDTGTLYRVRIGPFNQMDEVNKMRSKMTENGVDAAIVRTTK